MATKSKNNKPRSKNVNKFSGRKLPREAYGICVSREIITHVANELRGSISGLLDSENLADDPAERAEVFFETMRRIRTSECMLRLEISLASGVSK